MGIDIGKEEAMEEAMKAVAKAKEKAKAEANRKRLQKLKSLLQLLLRQFGHDGKVINTDSMRRYIMQAMPLCDNQDIPGVLRRHIETNGKPWREAAGRIVAVISAEADQIRKQKQQVLAVQQDEGEDQQQPAGADGEGPRENPE